MNIKGGERRCAWSAVLHSMTHFHMSLLGIGLCLISSGGNIHWGVNAWLEEDSLMGVMVLDISDVDVGTFTMDFIIDVSYLMGYTKGCGESCEELLTETESVGVFLLGDILDVYFGEDLGEELHAVHVIQGEKLVVLLLSDVMADGLSIDDGCHAELDFTIHAFALAIGFLLLGRLF